MQVSDKVLKFLQNEESQELLNNNKFEKLYEKFRGGGGGGWIEVK